MHMMHDFHGVNPVNVPPKVRRNFGPVEGKNCGFCLQLISSGRGREGEYEKQPPPKELFPIGSSVGGHGKCHVSPSLSHCLCHAMMCAVITTGCLPKVCQSLLLSFFGGVPNLKSRVSRVGVSDGRRCEFIQQCALLKSPTHV